MELVPPYSITKAVIRAQQYLTQTYPRFRVAFTEPSFYYDNAKPMFVRDGMDFIIIYIRIPVVSEEHLFRVYQVLSFPVPVRLQNTHDTDALQIVGLPSQIAVSLSRQYYIPMPASDYAGCYGETLLLCKDIPYLKRVTENVCIAALLRDDQGVITSKCDMDYLLNPDFGEMAIYLDDGQVLVVSAEQEGQLICGNKPPVKKKIVNYAKITLGCDCAFQTRGAWIPYSLRNCGGTVMEYEVQYPPSALLEARLRVQSWTTDRMGKEILEAPLSISDDPLPKELRKIMKSHAEGFTYRTPITQLIGRIKDRQRRISDHLTNIRNGNWGAYTWPGWLAMAIIIMVVIVIVCLVCRARSTAMAAVFATRVDRAAAARDALFCPPTPAPCPLPSTVAEVSSATLAVTVAILVMILLILWYRRRRIKGRMVDGLYVEFASPSQRDMVFLGEVMIPHDHIFVEGEVLVMSVDVNKMFLKTHVGVKWGQRVMGAATRMGDHPAVIPLPHTIVVSKSLARILDGPAQSVTMTRLLRRVSGTAYPVPKDVPRLIDAGWSVIGGRGGRDRPPDTRVDPTPFLETLPKTAFRDQTASAPSIPPPPGFTDESRLGTGAVYEPLKP